MVHKPLKSLKKNNWWGWGFLFGFCSFLWSSGAVRAESGWDLDSRLAVVGRTYPAGAMLVGNLGVGKRIWGTQEKEGPKAWQYGYIRGVLNGATSFVVNRIGPEIQFFPISIFGLSVGHDWGVRWFRPKWASCNEIECWGRIDRTYVRLQTMAAVKNVVISFNSRLERSRTFGVKSFLFDEMTVMSGLASGERILTLNPAILYRIKPKIAVGYTSILARAIDSGNSSHLFGPIVQIQKNLHSSWVVGLGQNRSNLVHPAFSGFFMYHYTFNPGEPIVDLPLKSSFE